MGTKRVVLLSLVVMVGVCVSAHAALVDMNDGTIYDTDTQLSWLKDANYAMTTGYAPILGIMTWDQAITWAESLNAGGGFAAMTGWRLPTSDTCEGYNCSNSEMGHLFYTELGNKGYPQAGWGLTNTGPFTNLLANRYWSGTEYAPEPPYVWSFMLRDGSQVYGSNGWGNYAMGVRPGARAVTPDINIDSQQYDFGDVEVGRPRTMFMTLSNSGGSDLVVNDIHMKYLISGNPFTFALPKALPITVAPNSTIEVEVVYSPTFLYTMQSNTLVISSNDSDEGTLEIPLQGQGIVAATSSQAVAQILYYIDYAIGHGLIVGEGNGNSPEKRIIALKNMIKSAGDLIDNSDITGACEQLGSIFKKVDGLSNPPDFVSGSGTPGVASGISGIMTNLGCN